jgi:hypothetical protein
VLVHVAGSYERDLAAGLGKHPPERSSIQQPEQEADVTANESVPIVMDGSDMHRDTELDLSRVAGHVVVATDQDTEPVRDSHQPCYWDRGRDDHQRAIASIFVHAAGPWHVGSIEGGLQHLVKRLVDVHLDVVIPSPAVEPDNVDSEQTTQQSIQSYRRRSTEHANQIRFVLQHDRWIGSIFAR